MRIIVSGILAFCMGTAFAQAPQKKKKIVKSQVVTADFIEPTLINGRPADPAEFPASVYASMGGSRCTGTIVGPKVMLIAAHCVSNGGTATFTVGPNRYSSICTQSRDYQGNSTADYAFCKVDRDVTGIKYEVVAQDESIVQMGEEILLTGYGCVRPGGIGGNDGVYRIGESTVTGLPRGTNNDITTAGGGALCFGDSGGPAFAYLDAARSKRVQVSVNSRGDIRRESYLSAMFTPQAKRFIQAYKQREPDVKICGVDADTPDCRDASDDPNPTPPPGNQCVAELNAFNAAKTTLDRAYTSLVDCLAL